jgi:hypothetical protein
LIAGSKRYSNPEEQKMPIRPPSLCVPLLLAAILVLSFNCQAMAVSDFFLGNWKIDKAVIAPWADSANKPDDAEMKSLVGKTVTFKSKQIAAPGILACKGPVYEIHDGGADMLFQGALAQKQDGSPQDPAKPAADLGFKGSSWKTLQTGCENELDFHFVDEKTMEFGLNDYVYVMKRE